MLEMAPRHLLEGFLVLASQRARLLLVEHSLFACRPDGQKKAYVRLTADYDALDVANKIGII